MHVLTLLSLVRWKAPKWVAKFRQNQTRRDEKVMRGRFTWSWFQSLQLCNRLVLLDQFKR